MRTCQAPGCEATTATSFTNYCRAHRARLRRHGNPDQTPVTKADLASYFKMIEARREKNQGAELWATLVIRWEGLQGQAKAISDAFQVGKVAVGHEVKAAHEVVKLGKEGEPQEVIDTALAMFMMWSLEPRRFRADRGFRTQLVRRVRGVGEVNVGSAWNNDTGKIRRIYRDVPPRVSEILATWFTATFGAAGMRLGELELRDIETRQAETQALYRSLAELN